MDREEYETLKSKKHLTFQQAFDFLCYDKVSQYEFSDLCKEVWEMKKKLQALHNFTHGHIEGNAAFRESVSIKNEQGIVEKIFTRHEFEGQQIVFQVEEEK